MFLTSLSDSAVYEPEQITDAIVVPGVPHPNSLPFRLGMPHLSATGLCSNWLLRECAHRHWHSIAFDAGSLPEAMRDSSGQRCFASIVSVVIDGRLDGFREDTFARFDVVEPPTALNGWRSTTRIVGHDCEARVELVSAFARRRGNSNRHLEAADVPEPMRSLPSDALPQRTRVLRARNRSFRIASEQKAPPIISARVLEGSDLNGVGLLYFANFLRFIDMVETEVTHGPWKRPPVARREVHYFGNADAGDRLDMWADVTVPSVAPCPRVVCFSTVRRSADGVAIAACETEWS